MKERTLVIETTHKTYGRVLVEGDDLYNPEPFVEVKLINERPNLPSRITVGKVALADRGGYTPKKRGVAERAQQYLPLVGKAVKTLKRSADEWDELFSVGCLGLVEADARFDHNSGNAFATYAAPYIMGYIKNHINPERNGGWNIVQNVFSQNGEWYAAQQKDAAVEEVMAALYNSLDNMTDKQQRVMKMLYIEGHTQEVVSKILKINIRNVERLRDRALRLVRGRLQ